MGAPAASGLQWLANPAARPHIERTLVTSLQLRVSAWPLRQDFVDDQRFFEAAPREYLLPSCCSSTGGACFQSTARMFSGRHFGPRCARQRPLGPCRTRLASPLYILSCCRLR